MELVTTEMFVLDMLLGTRTDNGFTSPRAERNLNCYLSCRNIGLKTKWR
jgi:hypothetical protein